MRAARGSRWVLVLEGWLLNVSWQRIPLPAVRGSQSRAETQTPESIQEIMSFSFDCPCSILAA